MAAEKSKSALACTAGGSGSSVFACRACRARETLGACSTAEHCRCTPLSARGRSIRRDASHGIGYAAQPMPGCPAEPGWPSLPSLPALPSDPGCAYTEASHRTRRAACTALQTTGGRTREPTAITHHRAPSAIPLTTRTGAIASTRTPRANGGFHPKQLETKT